MSTKAKRKIKNLATNSKSFTIHDLPKIRKTRERLQTFIKRGSYAKI